MARLSSGALAIKAVGWVVSVLTEVPERDRQQAGYKYMNMLSTLTIEESAAADSKMLAKRAMESLSN